MTTVLNAYTLSECMELMAEYAAAYEATGGKNLIFCEDRLTLIAERALVRRTGGTFLSSVTTFARYLGPDGHILSKQGSVMAVGGIMAALQRKKELRCFTSAAGIAGEAKSVYETIAQMAASDVTEDTLRDSLSLLPDDLLKDKLWDLAAIYREYLAFLRENGFVDESRYLSLLPGRIRADAELKGANVFFLCYNSLTLQAAEAVRAAAETAARVVGVFCSGKEEIYTNRAVSAFIRSAEECGRVQVRSLGTPLGGEAEVLRSGLYNPERLAGERTKTDKIYLAEAKTKAGRRNTSRRISASCSRRIRICTIATSPCSYLRPPPMPCPSERRLTNTGFPVSSTRKSPSNVPPSGVFCSPASPSSGRDIPLPPCRRWRRIISSGRAMLIAIIF